MLPFVLQLAAWLLFLAPLVLAAACIWYLASRPRTKPTDEQGKPRAGSITCALGGGLLCFAVGHLLYPAAYTFVATAAHGTRFDPAIDDVRTFVTLWLGIGAAAALSLALLLDRLIPDNGAIRGAALALPAVALGCLPLGGMLGVSGAFAAAWPWWFMVLARQNLHHPEVIRALNSPALASASALLAWFMLIVTAVLIAGPFAFCLARRHAEGTVTQSP